MSYNPPSLLTGDKNLRTNVARIVDGEINLNDNISTGIFSGLEGIAASVPTLQDPFGYSHDLIVAVSQADQLFPNNPRDIKSRYDLEQDSPFISNMQFSAVLFELFKHYNSRQYEALFEEYVTYLQNSGNRYRKRAPQAAKTTEAVSLYEKNKEDPKTWHTMTFDNLHSPQDIRMREHGIMPVQISHFSRKIRDYLVIHRKLIRKGPPDSDKLTYVQIDPTFRAQATE